MVRDSLYYSKDEEQEDNYHNFVQRFLSLLDKIKEKNKSIHSAVASFHILYFLMKYDAKFHEDEVYKAIIQDSKNIKEARPELQDEAKKVLNGYIEDDVETVSIYGSCAEVKLGANKHEFKVSEFLNSNFCKDNGISGFSTLHSNGKSGIHGFVSKEGIRHYIVTDGSYEMTLNWYDKDGKKCTIIINIDANGIELIERNGVTDDQLKANKDVKIGNLFLCQIKFRDKEKGNLKSSEIVIENGNRNINIQTTQEIECDSKETKTSGTKMQDKSTQAIDESLNERVNELEKENTRLTEGNETISEQLQQKVREIKELNGKLSKLEVIMQKKIYEKNKDLAKATQKLKQLSDALESEFKKRRIEKEELEKKLSEEKAELVQEKQSLEEYLKVLVVKIQKLIDKTGRSDLKLDKLANENKRLEQELNDTKKELDDKYSEIQRLESQLHELESKKVTELTKCLAEKEKKIAELEVQLRKEGDEASDLILKSWDLEEEKRRLQEELNEKTQKMAQLTTDLEELRKTSEEKETKYSEIKELRRNLEQARKESGELQNDISALKGENQNYFAEHQELLSEKFILEKEILRLKDQSPLAEKHVFFLQQKLILLIKDIADLCCNGIGDTGGIIINQPTLQELKDRLCEMQQDLKVGDQEIQGMLEEVSEQINDSPASSNMSNGDLSVLEQVDEDKITREQLQMPKSLTLQETDEKSHDISISPMKESNKINTTDLNQNIQKQNERKSPEKEKKGSIKKKNKENAEQQSSSPLKEITISQPTTQSCSIMNYR